MSDLRILRVIESMDPAYGGPCQGIRNSIPALRAMGAINEVVSVDGENVSWPSDDEFRIHKAGPGKGPWGYSPKLSRYLKKNLSKYDVVIVHGLWQYYGYAVRKAIEHLSTKNLKVPKFYIMPHGMLDPYFQKAPERKLKAMRNLIFWELIEKKTVRAADAILFTCQEELLLARETFKGYRPRKELNVGYGIPSPPLEKSVNVEQFRNKNGLSADEEYLLFLSRIHPKKGLLNLVKAYSECFNGKAGIFPKLVIAGPGLETEYGQSIHAMVQNDTLLRKNVLFVGMVTGMTKWAAFYGSKAFVLPSHQENFGIAVAEALACKCPVLISNKVNIWREIAEGSGGIVTEDTHEGTISLLQQFSLLTQIQVAEMKKNAYTVYRNHFTVEQAAINLYSHLKKFEHEL
ncbi:glycosyltransferase [Pareuzebyella sediminis]|uniref:glycosyltransferase n=1 Tax=Pareuzebyella sediminis TaxID=2607998 RepID=UPI001E504462|nr:glycosyltransferase [Pareuzebyella sediminis]